MQVICEKADECRISKHCQYSNPHEPNMDCEEPCGGVVPGECNPICPDKVEPMRKFGTGATRSDDPDRLDYEGFLCPLVLECFGKYMHKNRKQADGELRDSDNWQKGIPKKTYIKSKWRHFWMTWKLHRHGGSKDELLESLNAELFNTFGYMHELLKE